WDERESTVVTNEITERVRGYQATNSTNEGMLCFQEYSCQSCNAKSMRVFLSPTKSSTTVTRKNIDALLCFWDYHVTTNTTAKRGHHYAVEGQSEFLTQARRILWQVCRRCWVEFR
ncbi:unnamed protein product, partial [Ectocarpus sp. 13 AM-2016]